MVLHPAPSTDNASCTTTPQQKKKKICTLPPQLIMPPAPLPPCNNSFISLYAFFAREQWCRRHYQLRGQGAKKNLFARGQWCRRHYQLRGQGAKPFFRFDTFFDIQFKNTYNLILLGFKLSSERFLFTNFKTDLTF